MKHNFDVIHFNHLGGLPAEVLSIKQRLPNIKIIISLHDYYVLCPQINFLYQGKKLCEDSHSGKKCQSCLPVYPLTFSANKRRANRLFFTFIDILGLNPTGRLTKTLQNIIFSRKQNSANQKTSSRTVFENWHQIVDLINEYVDKVLPVSDRVRQIAIRDGIKADRLKVLRLGKNEAVRFRSEPTPKGPFVSDNGSLTLVYLGYMTIHKGFFFMLEAFERMPEELSRRINLVVAAKSPSDPSVLNRLMGLRPKLKILTHYDGYTHDQLDRILEKGSIGILCHLWEETGPLTAWEMHCRHIPFLSSNLGGAPEITRCKKMIYEHGNVHDCINRIQMILDGKITHEEYWENCITPITVEEHCKQLVDLYLS